jgi:serine-type D-Ala-D-Ala carboxypeptidase
MEVSMTSDSPPMAVAFERQDEVFVQAFAVLQEAITRRTFPGAAVAVTHRGKLIALKALGHFIYNASPQEIRADATVTPSTLFDLASLTKVIASTPMAMLLYERGLLDLDDPVAAIVPEFTTDAEKDSRRREVTVRMLLSHSSGLPAYEQLFLKARTRGELLNAAFTVPLATDPATRALYSDIGFIILGIALERLADEPLDRFCHREIFAPLGMGDTAFTPPLEIRSQIPPTGDEREGLRGLDTPVRLPQASLPQAASHQSSGSTFRRRIIQGEVQDENASVMGGGAAHAGFLILFCRGGGGPPPPPRRTFLNRCRSGEICALYAHRRPPPPASRNCRALHSP